jgi:hypothetical protein
MHSTYLDAQFLKVSENRRFLVTETGEPFFWLGDTGWEMLHRLDREEIDHYLRHRAAHGYTVIQTVILSELDGLTFPNMEGNLPFEEFDPERPNEAYFEFVDYAVKKAEEFGLVLALLPTWYKYVIPGSHPLEQDAAVFTEKNAFIYGEFLGSRYKDAPNIIWVLGGDWPAGPQIEIWNSMAMGLGEGDGGLHLRTYHPRGPSTSSTWLHASDWLDVNMIQTGHYNPTMDVYDWIAADYALTPPKPVINGEPAYEDMGIWFNPVNGRYGAFEVRRQAYWSVFAGAFGHTYGNNNIWQMNREDGKGVIWADKLWSDALEHPGGKQMQHLRSLMESRPFLSRIPAQELIKDENHSHAADYISLTRDGIIGEKDASYIMAYLPYIRRSVINTSFIPSERLKIWWYDPRTGNAFLQEEVENTGEFRTSNWSHPLRQEQGGPDWVLVIDDATAGYAAPGYAAPGYVAPGE